MAKTFYFSFLWNQKMVFNNLTSNFPRVYCCCCLVASVVLDSVQPYGLWPTRLLSPWGFSRQEYWSGLPCPPLGELPNQGLNPDLSHCRQILYHLRHHGSPRTLEWVAYPFSGGSSQPRTWSGVSCISGRSFTSWAIREAHWQQSLLSVRFGGT